MNNYNLMNDVSDLDLILYRILILKIFYNSFNNKKLLNVILERDIYLIYLLYLYNKWTINT